MIERETIQDSATTRILLRFQRMDDDGDLNCVWAAATETGRSWKNGRITPDRSWYTTCNIDDAWEFDSVPWARRFSKIVNRFKHLVSDGWEAEVVEVTDTTLKTRETKPRWPADAVEALADLGRDVADAG